MFQVRVWLQFLGCGIGCRQALFQSTLYFGHGPWIILPGVLNHALSRQPIDHYDIVIVSNHLNRNQPCSIARDWRSERLNRLSMRRIRPGLGHAAHRRENVPKLCDESAEDVPVLVKGHERVGDGQEVGDQASGAEVLKAKLRPLTQLRIGSTLVVFEGNRKTIDYVACLPCKHGSSCIDRKAESWR